MPVHDWSRVNAGIFHHFHTRWITALSDALNSGVLPDDYYALAEQTTQSAIPDLLTLQLNRGLPSGEQNGEPISNGWNGNHGGTAVAVAPPKVRFTASVDLDLYALKQRSLVIRHVSDDRIVSLLEILSPGNKSGRHAFRALLDKAVAALSQGYHLLLVDPHPPTPRDPQGIHGAVWAELTEDTYQAPSGKPLTLVSYSSGTPIRAYVEPFAVGDSLSDMPLFLEPETYAAVPLEATYLQAFAGVPRRWREVIEQA